MSVWNEFSVTERNVVSGARPRLRSVALPVEHGGWAFLLEPVLLGLLVAPTWAGFWLSLSALGVFLIHQPLRTAAKDFVKGKQYVRTRWALGFALLYGTLALIGFVLALLTSDFVFWLLLVLAVPLALIQLWYEARNRGKELLPELAGAVALLAVASAIALAGGWELPRSLALWIILVARTIGSILYIRARLRLVRGETIEPIPVIWTHVVGFILIASLVFLRLSPWLAAVMMLVLLARAVYGLTTANQHIRAQVIGFQELGFGLLYVIVIAIGYRL